MVVNDSYNWLLQPQLQSKVTETLTVTEMLKEILIENIIVTVNDSPLQPIVTSYSCKVQQHKI